MISVNLIPLSRRAARARRMRIKRWIIATGAYSMAIVVACISTAFATSSTTDADPAVELEAVGTRVQQASTVVAQLQQEWESAQRSLATARVIGPHPDWSVLLAMLADATGEHVFLRKCALNPRSADGASNGAAPGLYLVNIEGFGRTQTAVTDFVLRLEQSALPDSVTLVETNTELLKGVSAVRFTILGTIGRLEAEAP